MEKDVRTSEKSALEEEDWGTENKSCPSINSVLIYLLPALPCNPWRLFPLSMYLKPLPCHTVEGRMGDRRWVEGNHELSAGKQKRNSLPMFYRWKRFKLTT